MRGGKNGRTGRQRHPDGRWDADPAGHPRRPPLRGGRADRYRSGRPPALSVNAEQDDAAIPPSAGDEPWAAHMDDSGAPTPRSRWMSRWRSGRPNSRDNELAGSDSAASAEDIQRRDGLSGSDETEAGPGRRSDPGRRPVRVEQRRGPPAAGGRSRARRRSPLRVKHQKRHKWFTEVWGVPGAAPQRGESWRSSRPICGDLTENPAKDATDRHSRPSAKLSHRGPENMRSKTTGVTRRNHSRGEPAVVSRTWCRWR